MTRRQDVVTGMMLHVVDSRILYTDMRICPPGPVKTVS